MFGHLTDISENYPIDLFQHIVETSFGLMQTDLGAQILKQIEKIWILVRSKPGYIIKYTYDRTNDLN